MKISFHGADQGVTGSCHLIECAGKKILVDCGLYQGSREMQEENSNDFGFDPESVDFLLLTHAHLDHCGRIPLLVKRGFKGEIITTSASRDLAKLVMLDSAYLQEEEAEYRAKRSRREGKSEEIEPLYTTLDALNSLDYFGRNVRYGEMITLAPGIQATYYDEGHILGSACVLLELEENGQQKKVLFSGDIGLEHKPILRDPNPPHADIVVMETTYGDRDHKELKPSIDELHEAINDTLERGGNVIIPTFALERAQEILFYLREGVDEGVLPRHLPVFLDSPMAISATEIFRRHPECYDEETRALFDAGRDPFQLPGLRFTRETAESIKINQITSGAVIMAGSGMCTGGRVRHHLRYNLGRPSCSVVFVGYAARGTLARRIVDGEDTVRIFGDTIRVRANIYTIGGFSAHAGRKELLEWHGRTGQPEKTFLVHGELRAMKSFAGELQGTEIFMPQRHDVYALP